MSYSIFKKEKRERTLKNSEKKNLKKDKSYRCVKCKKIHPVHRLEIHHKTPVSKYEGKRTESMTFSSFISLYETKKRPAYDNKRNLLVLCANCHKDIHRDLREKEKRKKLREKVNRKATTPMNNFLSYPIFSQQTGRKSNTQRIVPLRKKTVKRQKTVTNPFGLNFKF